AEGQRYQVKHVIVLPGQVTAKQIHFHRTEHWVVLLEDASDSYLYSQHRLIGAVGVKDLVVVETKDAVLVAHKDKVQQVKGIVAQLKKQNRSEYLQHREIFRPWGSHDTIAEGQRYQVKHVIVLPGQVTAKQIHFHRTEHWVV
ncbi:hypothetical protein C3730_25200, partial [Salmonella enterica]